MHIIIAGAGVVGFHIASLLAEEKQEVVVVEQCEEALDNVHRQLDVKTILGNAATAEVERAIPQLRHRAKLEKILPRCVEINRLENVADEIYRSALTELFDDTTDMAQIIKWREIYEHMESATDRCEDVSNVLEGVALKHA